MKTKTYYDDVFKLELDTEVVSCKQDKDEYLVALKETLFFTESGGQPSDKGWINDEEVIDVYVYDGTIYHVLKNPVEGNVHVKIDAKTRMDHMQAHSGQHLAGAILIYEMHLPVLSNHYLQNGMCDLDIDATSFSKEQEEYLMKRCNECITQDIPYTISYVDEDTARKYCEGDFADYEGFESYRVVTIEGIEHDLCGCLHVPSSRWLKAIHVVSSTKISKGIRITLDCGDHMICNTKKYYDELNTLGNIVGTPIEEIQQGVEHLKQVNKDLLKQMEQYRTSYLDQKVEQILSSINQEEKIHLVKLVDQNMSIEDLKYIMVNLSNHPKMVCVGILKDQGKLSLVINKSKDVENFSAGKVFQEIRKVSSLRGGGSPLVAQGGGDCFEDDEKIILELVEKMLQENA